MTGGVDKSKNNNTNTTKRFCQAITTFRGRGDVFVVLLLVQVLATGLGLGFSLL